MKKVINGKMYDTDTARRVAEIDHGGLTNDLDYWSITIYRKKNKEFFLWNYVSVRDASCNGAKDTIKPLSDSAAKQWIEKNASGDVYVAEFGEVAE